jgi:hypothetical protein
MKKNAKHLKKFLANESPFFLCNFVQLLAQNVQKICKKRHFLTLFKLFILPLENKKSIEKSML